MIKPEVLDALVATGATAEMIVAAVLADRATTDHLKEMQSARNKRAYLRRKERANPPEEK